MPNLSRRRFLTAAGAAGTALATPVAHGAQTPAGPQPAITLCCSNYVRFLPIATGDVRPAGLSLTWIRGDRTEMLRRATDDPAVDGGETSMAQHVHAPGSRRSLAGCDSDLSAAQFHRPRSVHARADGGAAPATLGGRTLGIYNWAASGAVWYRHLLRTGAMIPSVSSGSSAGPTARRPCVCPSRRWPTSPPRRRESR